MPKLKKPILAELPEPEAINVAELAQKYLSGEVELICVLGPTASGKTKYAVRLARTLEAELGGCGQARCDQQDGCGGQARCEIISADSRQVYRGMDIGTGKDLADYDGIPYHIIDVADPGDGYNVYRFCEDFSRAYADIRSRGCVPILCGGTGLYINAVCSGYNFRDRKPLSAPAAAHPGPDGEAIPGRQPAGAVPASGSPSGQPGQRPPRTYFIGTLVSREVRNARIDDRLRARLAEGMIDEIRGLLDRGVPAETLISYGLEYKFVTLCLQGELNEDELFTQLSTAIHQFAKRQMTLLRGMERSGIRIHWTEV